MKVGDTTTAHILVEGGKEVSAKVKILGLAMGEQQVRVEMLETPPWPGGWIGEPTILGRDRLDRA